MPHREEATGYVVDVACLRRYPHAEVMERAKAHTQRCALMGHCIESGFGLVQEDGRVLLLDAEATLKIADAVRGAPRETGIKLRVIREAQPTAGDEEQNMATTAVQRID